MSKSGPIAPTYLVFCYLYISKNLMILSAAIFFSLHWNSLDSRLLLSEWFKPFTVIPLPAFTLMAMSRNRSFYLQAFGKAAPWPLLFLMCALEVLTQDLQSCHPDALPITHCPPKRYFGYADDTTLSHLYLISFCISVR